MLHLVIFNPRVRAYALARTVTTNDGIFPKCRYHSGAFLLPLSPFTGCITAARLYPLVCVHYGIISESHAVARVYLTLQPRINDYFSVT